MREPGCPLPILLKGFDGLGLPSRNFKSKFYLVSENNENPEAPALELLTELQQELASALYSLGDLPAKTMCDIVYPSVLDIYGEGITNKDFWLISDSLGQGWTGLDRCGR
jgi:hypothetical protein